MIDQTSGVEVDSFSHATQSADALSSAIDQLSPRMRDLESTANGFAKAMTTAFASSVTGGKQFDDVLKTLVLRISDIALKAAMAPLTQSLSSGISSLFSGLFGGAAVTAANGAVKPFAAGGIIGTPTYFPLAQGGLGLAGEAGPEAIVPLSRGSDGRLGLAAASAGGGAAGHVTINISTPDAATFRGSEVYLTGQIARAVARGQRGL